jgi:hypothetical protein
VACLNASRFPKHGPLRRTVRDVLFKLVARGWWKPNWRVVRCYAGGGGGGGGTPASAAATGHAGSLEEGTGAGGGGSMFASGIIQVTPQDKEAIERVSLLRSGTDLRWSWWWWCYCYCYCCHHYQCDFKTVCECVCVCECESMSMSV